MLATLAVGSFEELVQVVKHDLKKIQYRPDLIDSCLAEAGLELKPP